MIVFKKLSPNGHVFLTSKSLSKIEAHKIIEKYKNENKGGWYTFKVNANEVIVGNNLWNTIFS